MRRRSTFTLSFAVLVVAQVAVIAYWQSRRPPPSRIRDQVDLAIRALRVRASHLEECADGLDAGRAVLAEMYRKQVASDRQLADRLAADPADGAATIVAQFVLEHSMRHMARIREGGCHGPSREVE